jgi:nitrogen fixation protein NifZ
MLMRWDLGDEVRVTRNLRNDGTFPGEAMGALLIRRGGVGTVIDAGTFLGEQVIYTVHFLDVDRMVGCREEELMDVDEPWIPSAFESREKIAAARILSLGNDLRVPLGSPGEVLRVVREHEQVCYHVHFDCLPGRTLAVPESALASLSELNHA